MLQSLAVVGRRASGCAESIIILTDSPRCALVCKTDESAWHRAKDAEALLASKLLQGAAVPAGRSLNSPAFVGGLDRTGQPPPSPRPTAAAPLPLWAWQQMHEIPAAPLGVAANELATDTLQPNTRGRAHGSARGVWQPPANNWAEIGHDW